MGLRIADHKGPGRADIDDIAVLQLFRKDAWLKGLVAANVHAPQKNDLCHRLRYSRFMQFRVHARAGSWEDADSMPRKTATLCIPSTQSPTTSFIWQSHGWVSRCVYLSWTYCRHCVN